MRTRRRIHIARMMMGIVAGLLIGITCMAADTDNRFSPESQAKELMALWRNTCLKYFRDTDALRDAARKAGYLENPPNGPSMLHGESGMVWDVSSSVYSQRVLVSLDAGVCEVRGQIADSDTVQREFSEAVETLASDDAVVKQISNQKKTEAFIGQHQQTYVVVDKTSQKGWLFGAGTTDSALATTQAVISVVPTNAQGKTTSVSASAMDRALAEREALFDARGIDVPQLSKDIGTAVKEAERLLNQGKKQEALDRLLELEKYAPLTEVPSAMVHLMAAILYTDLGKADLAKQHRDLGAAYAVLLKQRIGKGDSPDDPIHVVMIDEISEWVRTQNASVVATRSLIAKGQTLTVVTYRSSAANNQPRDLYVAIDPRTQAQINASIDPYTPIAQSALRPHDKEWVEQAREKRERFLNDTSFPFLELQGSVGELLKAAEALDRDGKPQEALAKLHEIDKLRPIEDIPAPPLLTMYSYLVGKTGNAQKQAELRGQIFGAQQVIANSGDGKSPATAIHVILMPEEYDWLGTKKLKMLRQHLQKDGDARYDVLDVQDAQGATSQVYFDITRMYAKYGQGLGGAAAR